MYNNRGAPARASVTSHLHHPGNGKRDPVVFFPRPWRERWSLLKQSSL